VTVTAKSDISKFQNISGESQAPAITFDDTFDVTFLDACNYPELITLDVKDQSNQGPGSDDYSGTTLVFTYLDHEATPSWCDVTVTCNNVQPTVPGITCTNLSNGNNGEITWVFDDTNYNSDSPPGTYTFTFDVSVNNQVT